MCSKLRPLSCVASISVNLAEDSPHGFTNEPKEAVGGLLSASYQAFLVKAPHRQKGALQCAPFLLLDF